MRLIGSPFVEDGPDVVIHDPIPMYDYAANNRIRLLGVNAILERQRNDVLEKKRSQLLQRYKKTLGVFASISEILDDAGIAYAFFKSVRPYQEATVDLDVLIFGSHHREAVDVLTNSGHKLLEEGPLSTTVQNTDVPMNVDLYNEIGVSRFIYLDKDELRPFLTARDLENGHSVKSLDIKADLLALITHSVIKEQMYVLSEYYTTLGFVKEMTMDDVDEFINLTKRCYATHATSIHLNVTAVLHHQAHGFLPKKLEDTVQELELETKETSRIIRKSFPMPHKYHPSILVKSLLEKLGDTKSRNSVISQLKGIFDPSFGKTFLKAAFEHFTRETY